MKCLDCPYMACKVFYLKTERWDGFCLNPKSPKYRTTVHGNETCTDKLKI